MHRRFITALIVASVIILLAYTVPLNPKASASPQELTVISRTRGDEVLTAELSDNQVRIQLNNHEDTITAFAISFNNTTITEDFAYSDVHFGIEPGDTYQKSYPLSPSPIGSELPTVYLLTVLLKNGANDGNLKVAQKIEDERLGEKIQILRTLRVLEKEGEYRKDLKMIKTDIAASLNADEAETRIILSELQPTSRIDSKFSDDLRAGLQWGREKMLQRFEVLEQLSIESRVQGFIEFKERSHKLFAKL